MWPSRALEILHGREMQKWLLYRERPLLRRDLAMDEVEYVSEMARRIAAILLMTDALDENYNA